MRHLTLVGLTAAASAALAAPLAITVHDNMGDFSLGTQIAGTSQVRQQNGSSDSSQLAPQQNGSSGSQGSTGNQGSTGTDGSGSTGTTQRSSSGTSTVASAAQQQGVVLIDTVLTNGQAAGTGMVLTADGTVMTNYHVVSGSTHIQVTVPNGQKYTATVVGHDQSHDVAVLKLQNASGLKTVSLDTDAAKLSEEVLAVGQGNGEGVLYAAKGIVEATGESITASDETSLNSTEELTGLIKTNAPIVSGYSGGPLFDASGKVIGINTAASASNSLAGYNQSGASSSEGYAIPIAQAKSIADDILAGKKTSTNHIGTRAALGIAVQPSSSSSSRSPYGSQSSPYSSRSASGVSVLHVTSGSAAAKAGLEAGDIITAIGGTEIEDTGDLSDTMDRHEVGDSVKITWTDTDGTTRTTTITLEKATTN